MTIRYSTHAVGLLGTLGALTISCVTMTAADL